MQASVQGYLVPVDLSKAREMLDGLFIRDLHGVGLGSPRDHHADTIARVRAAVEMVRFWESSPDPAAVDRLQLDGARLNQIDEAFIPVVSLDGPGVLVWDNSD